MYSTQAVHRGDLKAFVEEAAGVDNLFIADKICPIHGVEEHAGEYPIIKIKDGSLLRRDSTRRNATGTYNEVTRKHGWDNYVVLDRGLEERVDDTKAKTVKKFFDLEKSTSKWLGRMMAIDREVSVKDLFFNTNNFTNDNALVNYTAALKDTVDFPADILAAIDTLITRGQGVNAVVLSRKLWSYIRQSVLLQTYIYGKDPDAKKRLLTVKDLESAFSDESGVDIKIHIGSASIDTSKPGAAASVISQVWPTSHIWVGNVKGGDFSDGGAARTLTWEQDGGSGLFHPETYRDEKRRGDMLRVRSHAVEKVIDETAGHLIVTSSDL